jgi:hypothetical protein
MPMRGTFENAACAAELHVPSEVGLVAAAVVFLGAVMVVILVLYLGIALRAALSASDTTDVRYQVFRDLLGIVTQMIELIGDLLKPFRGRKHG